MFIVGIDIAKRSHEAVVSEDMPKPLFLTLTLLLSVSLQDSVSMSSPTKELMKLVLEKRLAHGGNE
jgi:hypothetical protein